MIEILNIRTKLSILNSEIAFEEKELYYLKTYYFPLLCINYNLIFIQLINVIIMLPIIYEREPPYENITYISSIY